MRVVASVLVLSAAHSLSWSRRRALEVIAVTPGAAAAAAVTPGAAAAAEPPSAAAAPDAALAARLAERRQLLELSRSSPDRQRYFDVSKQRASVVFNTTSKAWSCPGGGAPCY